MPDSVIDTKTRLYVSNSETRIFTDDLIPNCDRCFVMAGRHVETKKPGFFAFCIKNKNLENAGPYTTYYEALKMLALTRGCVRCEYNKSSFKDAYLPFLDEKIREQMNVIYGNDQTIHY